MFAGNEKMNSFITSGILLVALTFIIEAHELVEVEHQLHDSIIAKFSKERVKRGLSGLIGSILRSGIVSSYGKALNFYYRKTGGLKQARMDFQKLTGTTVAELGMDRGIIRNMKDGEGIVTMFMSRETGAPVVLIIQGKKSRKITYIK